MLKLLICILSCVVLAALILQLRQQRVELAYQTAELHEQIRGQQGKLWNQQLLIASCTAPNAINSTINTHQLKMVPQAALPTRRTGWIDAAPAAAATRH